MNEELKKALPELALRDDTITAIERAVIEETGNGELADYLAELLLDYPKNRKRVCDLFDELRTDGAAKIQYLINMLDLPEGEFTFPDGDTWHQTSD